tara:strand:+ start:6955 stop:7710 length:756 start_codon:yes stop_codon:yes gene_type:complete
MTNKLPVVGQRYRHQDAPNLIVKVSSVEGGIVFFEKHESLSLTQFYYRYEELPQDNSQETEECCPIETAEAAWNMSEVNETPNSVDLEKIEVNKVEWALEELKDRIKNQDGIHTLTMYAKKLVAALEAEKMPEVGCGKEAYNKWVMSKPEPKIDMKEERVEPVSIWKDVSELPEDDDLIPYLIKSKNGSISIGEFRYFDDIEKGVFYDHISQYDNNVEAEEIENVKSYTTLTDFINSFEQMQKDIEQLKRK